MPQDMSNIDQMDPELAGAVVAGFLAFLCVILTVVFVINVIVCFLLYKPLSKLPESFRPFNPGLVFLMLIPIANFVMPFMISISFTDGFKNYFESIGDQSNGDCGKTIGLVWAIAGVCSIIPIVNYLAPLVALICMIIFVVKLWSMGNKVNTAK
jgi:hypothetical protein